MSVAAIVLSSLGAIAELAGLLLVASEIAADRKRAQEMLSTLGAFQRPNRQYPGRVASGGGLRSPYAGPYSNTKDQLDRIGRDLDRLARGMVNAVIDLRKIVDAQDDAVREEILNAVAARDAELRSHLRYVLVGGIRARVLGACLLALGIVLGAAGSILGNV
jgi:hypothetical protein